MTTVEYVQREDKKTEPWSANYTSRRFSAVSYGRLKVVLSRIGHQVSALELTNVYHFCVGSAAFLWEAPNFKPSKTTPLNPLRPNYIQHTSLCSLHQNALVPALMTIRPAISRLVDYVTSLHSVTYLCTISPVKYKTQTKRP